MVDYSRQAERHLRAGGKCFTGFVSDVDFERACRLASESLKEILKEELSVFRILNYERS